MGAVTVGYKCHSSWHLVSGRQWLGIGWAPWRGGGGGGTSARATAGARAELGTWASRTRKHGEAGCGWPEDGRVWTAKTLKRPPQQPAHPQYANYWAPLTRKRHTMPHPAQPQHTSRSSRQNAATRRNMRREERVAVQGQTRGYSRAQRLGLAVRNRASSSQPAMRNRALPLHPAVRNRASIFLGRPESPLRAGRSLPRLQRQCRMLLSGFPHIWCHK